MEAATPIPPAELATEKVPMDALVIQGGRPLSGRITVEGNKNAALPLLAACLLTSEDCVLQNVPRIRDVAVMIDLLRSLGREEDAKEAESRAAELGAKKREAGETKPESAA